jgi:membrane protein YqaA with SNARE-associated domain
MLKKAHLFIENYKKTTANWVTEFAQKKRARVWLAFFAFAESSFFPIPTDLFLIALLLANRTRWFFDAFITTTFSVLGGLAGYLIGAFFFLALAEPLIVFYGLEADFQSLATLFADNAFLAIFAAAFTPIPYKVFTIGAGFFSVNVIIFIFASFLGRGMRFFAVAYIAQRWGEQFRYLIFKYFNIVSLIVLAVIALALVL